MKTGIVFELSGGKATVLKSNGEFITIPASGDWQKGDVVQLLQHRSFSAKYIYAMAASLALLIITGLWGGNLYFTPVALVSMDVNPSIELELNRFDKVVSMQAMNEDGEIIVLQNNVVYQDYEQAVAALLREDSGFASYLQDNPEVVFAVYAKDADKEALLTEGLEGAAGNVSVKDVPIAVECHSVDEETIKSATKYGVSPGKYLYLRQLMEADSALNIEDFTHHSIKQLKEEIVACGEAHGDGAGGEDEADEGHGDMHGDHE